MAEYQHTYRIRSDQPSWLHAVRDIVSDALDVDDETATLYLVAVTEIVVNAEQIHRELDLAVPAVAEIDIDRRQVSVTDHGGGFEVADHGELAAPDEVTGRGLHLAKAFCPGLSASRTHDGMRFTLPFPRQ